MLMAQLFTLQVKVLKCIPDLKLEDMILGQYEGRMGACGDDGLGYQDDPTVPKDSKTATYVMAVLHINNERWDGVPFILRCGKGETKMSYVPEQFNSSPVAENTTD